MTSFFTSTVHSNEHFADKHTLPEGSSDGPSEHFFSDCPVCGGWGYTEWQQERVTPGGVEVDHCGADCEFCCGELPEEPAYLAAENQIIIKHMEKIA